MLEGVTFDELWDSLSKGNSSGETARALQRLGSGYSD